MKQPGLLNSILRTALLAGTLDILAAILILAKGNAVGTLKFIAGGVFGKSAFSGGMGMVVLGTVFHYTIALCFTIAYYWVYPHLPLLKKNKWVSGTIYGLLVWATMNLLVLPVTRAPQRPLEWDAALINMAILVACIGIPIAWLADKFYVSRNS